MAKVLSRIMVPFGAIEAIAKDLGYSRTFVSEALLGKRSTALAKRVREVARKNYNGKILSACAKRYIR